MPAPKLNTGSAASLAHRLRHYRALSGGEQQRVAVARAFAPKPMLILADRQTNNLDAATGHQIIELMFAINAERGTTLILVTHDEGDCRPLSATPAYARRADRGSCLIFLSFQE